MEGGVYENTYVNVGGVWKIKKLFYRAFWHGTMEDGWAHTPVDYVPNASVTYPEDPYGPDELLENAPRLWPETDHAAVPLQAPGDRQGVRPRQLGLVPRVVSVWHLRPPGRRLMTWNS